MINKQQQERQTRKADKKGGRVVDDQQAATSKADVAESNKQQLERRSNKQHKWWWQESNEQQLERQKAVVQTRAATRKTKGSSTDSYKKGVLMSDQWPTINKICDDKTNYQQIESANSDVAAGIKWCCSNRNQERRSYKQQQERQASSNEQQQKRRRLHAYSQQSAPYGLHVNRILCSSLHTSLPREGELQSEESKSLIWSRLAVNCKCPGNMQEVQLFVPGQAVKWREEHALVTAKAKRQYCDICKTAQSSRVVPDSNNCRFGKEIWSL